MNERILPQPTRSESTGGTGLDSFRGFVATAPGPASDDAHNLWKLLNDRLSGRWKYAVPLAILLSVLLATGGYLSTQPTYESSGVIRVVPNIVPVLRQTAETGLMPLYANFVQTQASLVTSSRVRERAVQKLDLSQTPWEDQQEALQAMRGVAARAERGSELIIVSFSAESPATAQAVINAVLEAYHEIHGSDGDDVDRRLQRLREIRERERGRHRTVQSQIDSLVAASEYGISDYRGLIGEKASYIHQAELELRKVSMALRTAHAKHPEQRNADATPDSDVQPDPRMLESFDPELARLGQLRKQVLVDVELARERLGPSHRGRMSAEERLRVIERMYTDRLLEVHEQLLESGQLEFADPSRELELRAQQLEEEIRHEREAVRRLTQAQQSLDSLHAELAEIDQELSTVSARLRALEVESDALRSGRIVIAAMGDRPTGPSRDRRRHLAALGAMAGLGAGIGLFFVLGSLDRRAFAVGQLSGLPAAGRVLGVLPALPRKSDDLESAGIAAHCIHQIRNKIEAARHQSGCFVLAVSSPEPNDGKTSLSLSLAASYATAGSRTLLIDCDMYGRGLSQQTRQVGKRGLCEALSSKDIPGSIHALPYKNLSVMPCGGNGNGDFGPEMVRKNDLSSLFDQLRTDFDIVVVDTGPVFGSIESLPVASAVDGVVLTIRRGGRQSHLEDCVKSLRSVGANYTGLVLNFANASDCRRYVSKSRVSEPASRNGKSEAAFTHNVLVQAINRAEAPPSDEPKQ